MQYVVNGVVFDDEAKAKSYEKTLEEKARQESKQFEDYKNAIASKLKVFQLTHNRGKVTYLAIIVDGDEHYKYATAIAEDRVGRRYLITDNSLHTNWTLKEVKNDNDGILSSILSSLAYGTPSKVEYTVFQGVAIDCPSPRNIQRGETGIPKEVCDWLNIFLGLR